MTTARTQVSLYKSIERYGYLRGNRDDTEATAAEIMRDFIVIPRSDLPEVTKTDAHDQPARDHYVHHRDTGQAKIMRGKSAEKHRRWAAEHLALAEHLEAHPPIDEAAVYALGLVCIAEGVADPHRTARRLVAAGVRAPQAGDDQ